MAVSHFTYAHTYNWLIIMSGPATLHLHFLSGWAPGHLCVQHLQCVLLPSYQLLLHLLLVPSGEQEWAMSGDVVRFRDSTLSSRTLPKIVNPDRGWKCFTWMILNMYIMLTLINHCALTSSHYCNYYKQ